MRCMTAENLRRWWIITIDTVGCPNLLDMLELIVIMTCTQAGGMLVYFCAPNLIYFVVFFM